MGIALLTLADLFMPFQSLAHRWMSSRAASRGELRYVGVRPACGARGHGTLARARPQPAVVRVVRVVEQGRSAAGEGRLLISGRMADVCAELDRLVALEAARDHMPDAKRLH